MAKLDKFLKLLKSFSKADNLDEPAEGYIYNILDTKNGKNYVGSKLGAIDNTENYLGSGTVIKRIAKKRPDDLYKTILGKTKTRRELMEQEEAWLKAYRAAQDDNMYNLKNSYRGQIGSNPSKATRDKMSKAKIGHTPWNKGKKGVITGRREGFKMTEESKRKISEGKKGRPSWNKGKKGVSKETSEKMSKSLKGKPAWNKGKKTGKASEETKRKLREAAKLQWKRQKGLL